MMNSDDLKRLEAIAGELLKAFDVKAPPVPVESMLQKPPPGMWGEINVSQLTGSFLSVRDPYSPRMSMARLLARHVINCEWGRERGLPDLIKSEEDVRTFSRMLVMPKTMIEAMTTGARNPVAMSMNFEVPEDDAQGRLIQIAAT
jgi:hypothetical protein